MRVSRLLGLPVVDTHLARQALSDAGTATELRLSGSSVLAVIGPDRPSVQAVLAAAGG